MVFPQFCSLVYIYIYIYIYILKNTVAFLILACTYACTHASILPPRLFLFTAYMCVHIFRLAYVYTHTLMNYSHICVLGQHIRPSTLCISFSRPAVFLFSSSLSLLPRLCSRFLLLLVRWHRATGPHKPFVLVDFAPSM